MENNNENKAKFFAQYWGFNETMVIDTFMGRTNILSVDYVLKEHSLHSIFKDYQLLLKPLSLITDEELIHVARLAHQLPKRTFFVDRSQDDIFYVKTGMDNVGIEYFISMRPKYATVLSTINFSKIQMSSEKPIPYIAIVDYLRSKSYAIPYNGLSVDQLIKYGWVKLKETEDLQVLKED